MARRIARLALDAAIVTAVVVAVFIAYGLIGNRWYRVVAVASGSMEPALPVGSLIVITPASDPLAVGEVITFNGDGRLVTHRIASIRPDGFPVTRGDANNVDDTFTNVTVVGQVRFTIPLLGFVLPQASASGAIFRAASPARRRSVLPTTLPSRRPPRRHSPRPSPTSAPA